MTLLLLERSWPLNPDGAQIAPVRLFSHLITKRHHAAVVGRDLQKVEGHVFVAALEKRDSVANQDGHDRIAHFVSQLEAQAFSGY